MVNIEKSKEYQELYNKSKKVLQTPYDRWKTEDIMPLVEQIVKEDKVLRKELKSIIKRQMANLAILIVDNRQTELSFEFEEETSTTDKTE